MFYCDPCRVETNWPSNVMGALSNGRCEICGKPALCHDVPSSALPRIEAQKIDDSSPERRHAQAEIPADGAYDKRRKLMGHMDDAKRDVSELDEYALIGKPASKPAEAKPKDPMMVALQQGMRDDAAERKRMTAERIVAAAIQIEGVTISLPRPARHGTILACTSYSLNMEPGRELQGFLTSSGRFVNRIQARHIADIAGQKPGRSGGRDNPELFSEDLW